jgi:hypothetical protein
MKEIPHRSRKYPDAVILVDDEDYEAIMAAGPWFPSGNGRGRGRPSYVRRMIRRADGVRTTEFLHNFICRLHGLPKSPDHANRNGLDNRKENFREATPRQQAGNRRMSSLNTSGFKGVSWCKDREKWRAYADRHVNGKKRQKFLGYYGNLEDAARAYNKWALDYFEEFAVLNCVNGVPL